MGVKSNGRSTSSDFKFMGYNMLLSTILLHVRARLWIPGNGFEVNSTGIKRKQMGVNERL